MRRSCGGAIHFDNGELQAMAGIRQGLGTTDPGGRSSSMAAAEKTHANGSCWTPSPWHRGMALPHHGPTFRPSSHDLRGGREGPPRIFPTLPAARGLGTTSKCLGQRSKSLDSSSPKSFCPAGHSADHGNASTLSRMKRRGEVAALKVSRTMSWVPDLVRLRMPCSMAPSVPPLATLP